MLYIEAYNSAIEEMDKHYFEQHPDLSFNYFLFDKKLKQNDLGAHLKEFMVRLDACKFYKAPKNKEDNKFDGHPEHIKILWDAVKVACFLISLPDLNCKDLLYHNIDMSLGVLYGLHSEFKDALPAINECLQSIVLGMHPQAINIARNGHAFFRASKSEQSLANQGISPSFVRRPLTFT